MVGTVLRMGPQTVLSSPPSTLITGLKQKSKYDKYEVDHHCGSQKKIEYELYINIYIKNISTIQDLFLLG